jgi:cytochrome c-type biogenesis protein CcsB
MSKLHRNRSSRAGGASVAPTWLAFVIVAILSLFTSSSMAQTTQPADAAPTQPLMSDDAFAAAINLDKIRALSLQDRQTIKTWDTFARQTISQVHSRGKFEGRDPLFTLFDLAFNPSSYFDRPMLRIKNPQFLADLLAMPGLDAADRASIEKNKAVSLRFWTSEPVQVFVTKMQKDVIASRDTINQIHNSATTLMTLLRARAPLETMAFVPPASGNAWHRLPELQANMMLAFGSDDAEAQAKALPGYDNVRVGKLAAAATRLAVAWTERDVATAQSQIDLLTSELPTLTAVYPSQMRRSSEVLYNKFYKLTLPGAAIYFVAFVLFLTSAYSKGPRLWRWAIAFTVAGLLLHTLGIGIRWWLDQKSTQSWFYSIPIKNQFESVMFSAWFGMLVGLCLELWKKKGLYGAAASFVGWMSLVALFTVPYVFGKDIGNEIGRVNGILMSYWLYIHVTLATASYALIGMSFLLGVWWLIRYITAPNEIRTMSGHRVSSDAVEKESNSLAMAFAGGPVPALAGGAMEAFPDSGQGRLSGPAKRASTSVSASQYPIDTIRSQLANLDACNVVILQLAFWILGVAIVCGAIWADVSWGRPWGWDPKETFALVTWIVYLVILHVRMVTKQKALWTAILCIVGFFVMLFNWIGVNYFLVGLHSYA